MRVLVTGSAGLIGSALCEALARRGDEVHGFDVADGTGDVTRPHLVSRAVERVDGIVHLAAVSRVAVCERDPDLCWRTNVVGLRNVLGSMRKGQWILFASSREVYGDQTCAFGTESTRPLNCYASAKVVGENLIEDSSFRHGIVRLSNVYGSVHDHLDRVVPAFTRAAVWDEPLCVEGPANTFDFTFLGDVVRGLLRLIEVVAREGMPHPVHFTSGIGTTLLDLAQLCIEQAISSSRIVVVQPRDFDVHHFVGDPTRASWYGWEPLVPLRSGLMMMIDQWRDQAAGGATIRRGV